MLRYSTMAQRQLAKRLEVRQIGKLDVPKPPPKLGPFSIFVKDNYAKMQAENPELKNRMLMQVMASHFREHKDVLMPHLLDLKAKYDAVRSEWFSNVTPSQILLMKAKSKASNHVRSASGTGRKKLIFEDHNMPSKPAPPFPLFVKQIYNSTNDQQTELLGTGLKYLSFAERAKALASAWATLSPEVKETGKLEYKLKLQKYRDDLKAYKELNGLFEVEKAIGNIKLESIAASKPKAPKKKIASKKVAKKKIHTKVARKILTKTVVKKIPAKKISKNLANQEKAAALLSE